MRGGVGPGSKSNRWGWELRDCTGSPAFVEVIPVCWREGCVRSGFLLTGRRAVKVLPSGLYDGVRGIQSTLYIV